ncbi:MAG: hypothetical protein JSW60_08100 [Thermoplasmatales archaeon]|nr:MAG: hypothetical protein JSW60_08100 [Thermoplasmatales archaeon]
MKNKILPIMLIGILIVASLTTISMAKPNKNDGPKPGTDFSGPHYLLNILGKKHIGNGTYDDPDRRSIFVPLEGDTTIRMKLGADFRVLDGNGLDGECGFQMPRKQKNFYVYIVALGKPMDGTNVNYTSGWTYDNDTGKWYRKLNESFFIQPHKGRPKWMNVTGAFWINLTFWNSTYLGWLWQVPEWMWEESLYFWDLKGSDRHIQVRFYPY